MIALSHPTVNSFNRALAEALHRAGRLAAFHTTLAFGRRRVDLPRAQLRQHWWPEIGRLVAARFPHLAFGKPWRGMRGIDLVYRTLDARVAAWIERENPPQISAVYGYEDGALATFQTARRFGLRCFYELPIAYWRTARTLLEEEAARLPEWAHTLLAPDDGPEKLARKTAEAELADLIICPSAFVQRTVPAGRPTLVAEFGSPPLGELTPWRATGPLRVLFAGSMTQRKGLGDLFAAMRLLGRRPDLEFIVLGAPIGPFDFYRSCWPHFIYEPPRAHAAVLQLMQSCDVLVLPSIVEGRALVQQEALSCGLPLIVTTNAGAEDLVETGQTGWLVPIRQPDALAERLDWLASHRAELEGMRPLAQKKAAERTWAKYTEKILATISSADI